MTNIARITVAVATLNRPDALTRCLNALSLGEMLPEDVLVIDQSENDSAREIVNQGHCNGVSFRYVRQGLRGLSASRNAALQLARSDVVAMIDDDCVPAHDWVARIDCALNSVDAPAALSGRVLPLGPPQPGMYAVSSRPSEVAMDYRGRVAPWEVGTGGNFAIQRQWFQRVGLYDQRLGAGSPGMAAEDADYIYRLLRMGGRIHYEPGMLVYHERQDQARRMATRWSYSYGIGAMCGLMLRRADLYSLFLLLRWLARQVRGLATATAGRNVSLAQQRSLGLRGTLHGFAHGVRLKGGH